MQTDHDLIGAAEAARLLKLDRSTLTRKVDRGEIAFATKLPGKRGAYLFDKTLIEALAAKPKADGDVA